MEKGLEEEQRDSLIDSTGRVPEGGFQRMSKTLSEENIQQTVREGRGERHSRWIEEELTSLYRSWKEVRQVFDQKITHQKFGNV